VQVHSEYSPSRSAPKDAHWFFLYPITITNEGPEAATLTHRNWVITNAKGEVSEVQGPGVVGEHPRLESGNTFEYTSACPLDTSFGTLAGTYTFEREGGESFKAEVPTFSLAMPYAIN
jgi:ApaG protein